MIRPFLLYLLVVSCCVSNNGRTGLGCRIPIPPSTPSMQGQEDAYTAPEGWNWGDTTFHSPLLPRLKARLRLQKERAGWEDSPGGEVEEAVSAPWLLALRWAIPSKLIHSDVRAWVWVGSRPTTILRANCFIRFWMSFFQRHFLNIVVLSVH